MLLEEATLEGWVDVMHNGVAGVGIGRAPVPDDSPIMALYFVVFIVVGGLELHHGGLHGAGALLQ